jgi:hypothetical protein
VKRSALVAVVVAPTLALALAACGDDGDKKLEAAAVATCGALPTADPSATLPTGFPAVPGQVLYMPASAGKTTVVHGLVTGTANDPTTTRDEVVTLLKAAGYTIDGTDQEAGREADADFSGPNKGSISVHPYCLGHLDIKYTINGS